MATTEDKERRSPDTQDAHPQPLPDAGVEGNERLTGVTGAVLILMLAVIGVTIARIGQLLWLHLFVSVMLLGPIGLKLASTGYRFASYYTGRPTYKRKGPPITPLRILAGPVVLSTVLVMASGIVMLLGGPSTKPTWLPIHKVAFIAWIAFMALHVIAHIGDSAHSVRLELGPDGPSVTATPARNHRLMLLGLSLLLGVGLALIAIPDFSAWSNM